MRIDFKKVIVKNRRYTISPEEMWLKWSTSEGLKSFMGYDNKIALRIGGEYEIYFIKDNPSGLRGGEGCKILSYVPNRMLSFTWSAPPEYPEIRNNPHKTWIVLLFNEISSEEVEMILYHLGWPKDEKWDGVYNYFSTAWDTVLDWLDECLIK